MWYILLGIIAIVYILEETLIPSLSWTGAYIIRPIAYIALGVSAILIATNQGGNILSFKRIRRWYLGNNPQQAGLLIGGFQIALLIIIGLFAGFGNSPYSFKPIPILFNLFFVSAFLFGVEISRSYFINTSQFTRRKFTLILTLTTLLYIVFLEISPSDLSFFAFADPPSSLEFIGATIIPALAMNLLACYLVYLGGATASIAYMGILMGFEWFSPILPTPHWTILALIGTIGPAIGFILIEDSLKTRQERKRQRRKEASSSETGWTIIAIAGIFIVFFSFGFLGFTPTVIYSGSMAPTYEVGDIVLIEDDYNKSALDIGDIIQYVAFDNQTLLVHRIINITTVEDQTAFITKGDANDDPDFKPIPLGRVQGKAIFTIPKLGWIQIAIKSIFRTLSVPI